MPFPERQTAFDDDSLLKAGVVIVMTHCLQLGMIIMTTHCWPVPRFHAVTEDEGMALLDALSPSDRARALKRLAKLQLKEQEAQQVRLIHFLWSPWLAG